MNKPQIQVLVGMIASGKSSYSQNAARAGAVIVNATHGNIYTLYDKTLKPLYKTLQNTALSLGIALGRTVVVDNTNLSELQRQRWIALARSLDVPAVAIVFKKEPIETHAQRRTDSDSRGVSYEEWLKIARVHSNNYEMPLLSEGFYRVINFDFKAIQEGQWYETEAV